MAQRMSEQTHQRSSDKNDSLSHSNSNDLKNLSLGRVNEIKSSGESIKSTKSIPKDIQEMSKKLDQVLSKRPASSSSSQIVLQQSLTSTTATTSKVLSTHRNMMFVQSFEKLKASGNTDVLKEMEDRDKKLKLFMAKAGSIGYKEDVQFSDPSLISSRTPNGKGQNGSVLTRTPLSETKNSKTVENRSSPSMSSRLKVSIDLPPEVRRKLNAQLTSSPKSAQSAAIDQYFSPRTAKVTDGGDQKDGQVNENNSNSKSVTSDIGRLPFTSMWHVQYDRRGLTSKPGAHNVDQYESQLVSICRFKSVQLFWKYINHLKPASQVELNANFHVFRDGIKPIWEDVANKNGGKWNVIFPPSMSNLVDNCWIRCLCAIVGESIDSNDEVCGAVFSRRSKGDRLALWIKNSDDNEKVMEIGAKFVVALDLAKQKDLQIEFHPHSKVLTSVSHGSKSRSNNALNGLSDIDMNQMKKRIVELSQA